MTISTFRSLEQQAIRQYKEARLKENNQHVYKETFRQENAEIAKVYRINQESKIGSTLINKVLDYFA
jgi:hypothetical protein